MTMKMVKVFNLMANNAIKDKTEIVIYYDSEIYVYKYHKLQQTFLDEDFKRMEEEFVFGVDFLNFEVDVIPPEENKFLIKFNMRGLKDGREYLNLGYDKYGRDCVHLSNKCETASVQTRFTKSELQSIKVVREFLEDMNGKYELVEVDKYEIN